MLLSTTDNDVEEFIIWSSMIDSNHQSASELVLGRSTVHRLQRRHRFEVTYNRCRLELPFVAEK